MQTQYFFEFKDFRLDPIERVLLRNGAPVYLTPKAFQLLSILVENHGHIVDKEKLIGEIWADSFVEDGNLAVNATALRKALEDNAARPTFIETVPRRGYRFIAPVTRIAEDKLAGLENELHGSPSPLEIASSAGIESNAGVLRSDVDLAESRSLNRSGLGRNSLLTLSALAILVMGGLAAYYFFGSKSDTVAVGRKSIAVLPIKPINTTNRDELYELGIAESLILKLSSVKDLDVRPLSATRKYADLSQDPLAAGKEQQVDYVLDSNYQLSDGKIRLTARLFNVATREIEDTYKSERESSDVFSLQDLVAGEIGNAIFARLGYRQTEYSAKRGTENEEAYRLYMRGKYLQEKRNLTDTIKAVELLDESLRLDPNYARAWAVKSFAHFVKTVTDRSISPHLENKQATEAANRALELDPNLSEAHAALCEIKMSYEWDLAGAEPACKRAVELDPNSTIGRQTNSRLLMAMGRSDEAIAEANAAIDLEPASLLNHRIYGCAFFEARRYDEAITVFKRTIELDPNSGIQIYYWLVEALQMKGNDAETFEWFMKGKAVAKTGDKTLDAYRTGFGTAGWRGVLEVLADGFQESDTSFFDGVYTNARLGRKDKAFEYLEKAYQRREWSYAYINVEPRLDPLRDDPRFEDLLTRVVRK